MAVGFKTGGRKKGSLNKRTVKLVEAARDLVMTDDQIDSLTPLAVMMYAMRLHIRADDWTMASSIAEKAAPYMHPKLAARVIDEAQAEPPTLRIVGGLPE